MTQTKNYKDAPFSKVHSQIYWAMNIGQIACAYALNVAGIAFGNGQHQLGINNFLLGLLGAASLIGLIGSFFMGQLADRFGRKHILMSNMYIFTILSLLQYFTTNVWLLLVLRLLIGLMIAVDYTVGNALMVEWLPTKDAAAKQSHLLFYWTLGLLIAYVTGHYVSDWRLLLASSAVFGLIAALNRSFIRLPASPSWLASHNQNESATELIQERLGKEWGLPKHLVELEEDPSINWMTLFSKDYWRQTLAGTAFYATQSFAFFGINIFLPILLKSMDVTDTYLAGLFYNIATVAGPAIGIYFFNKYRRRSFLIVTFSISSLCLFILAFGKSINSIVEITIFTLLAVILTASVLLDFPYTSELFDIKLRGTGVGFVIAMSRIGAALGTFLLPVVVSAYGSYVTMAICGVVLLLGTVICYFVAPETNPRYVNKD